MVAPALLGAIFFSRTVLICFDLGSEVSPPLMAGRAAKSRCEITPRFGEFLGGKLSDFRHEKTEVGEIIFRQMYVCLEPK